MISYINDLIKDYLQNSLEVYGINQDDLEYDFNIPTKIASEKFNSDTVSIYLLDIQENQLLKQNEWKTNFNSDGQLNKVTPTIMLDTYFIISLFSKLKDAEVEHILFKKVLSCLYKPDFISHLNTNHSIELAREISIELFPQQYIRENLSLQLWSAIDQNIRPFISLKVTVPLLLETSISMTSVKTKEINYALPDEKVYTIKGRVMSKKDQNNFPVQATIELINQGGEIIQTVQSNTLGFFNFSKVNREHHTVNTIATGFKDEHIILEDIKMQSTQQLLIMLDKSLT